MEKKEGFIIVRGGGDLATGVIRKLWSMNQRVLVLETEKPSAIRRLVAFSEAIYQGEMTVEGATSSFVEDGKDWTAIERVMSKQRIPIIIDPKGDAIYRWKPEVVIDAIIAKKNMGTRIHMAPLTIALGPGFEAGTDVDIVIETMRGPHLGEAIYKGYAIANTGVPGKIQGVDKDRVLHAEWTGILRNEKSIGTIVEKGQVIAYIETPLGGRYKVVATIDGVLRGLIRDGYQVKKGFKIADIDPRMEQVACCDKITDKAICIAERVAEVIERRYHSIE